LPLFALFQSDRASKDDDSEDVDDIDDDDERKAVSLKLNSIANFANFPAA
jgi:hypothetical protein